MKMFVVRQGNKTIGTANCKPSDYEGEIYDCDFGKYFPIRSSWLNYFESWDEARDFMRQKAIESLTRAQKALDRAEKWVAKVENMKRPAD